MPENVRLYESVDAALAGPTWDWVLTHNVQDLLDARNISLPKIFLIHGTLSGRILQDRASIDRAEYVRNLETLLRANRCTVVYISQLKRDDWGIPGRVIRTAINTSFYGGYKGGLRGILQVGNHLRERGAMLGWEAHEHVCRGLPHLILGNNRGLADARETASWEDLKEQYRSYRLYLHTAVHPYEDGYNLAMLEAMATGMPVAAMSHPTSPIRDGIQGVVESTAEGLRERVLFLLDNPGQARLMGRLAQQTVAKDFPLATFRSDWQAVAESVL